MSASCPLYPQKGDIARTRVLGRLGAERSAPNLALPTAIGILVDLSLSCEPACDALSEMMTSITRYYPVFTGNRAAE